MRTRTTRPRRRLGWWLLAGLLGVAAVAPGRAPAQSTGYKVIVNSANPTVSMSRADVAKLFLKKTIVWKSGGEVLPVDLREDSEVRRTFSRTVLGKEVSSVKGYWQERIFTGKGVPPVEKPTESEAVAFVAANPHAIAYVSTSTPLGANVKVLTVVE